MSAQVSGHDLRADVASCVQKASEASVPAQVSCHEPCPVRDNDVISPLGLSRIESCKGPDGNAEKPVVSASSDHIVSPTAPWTFPAREVAPKPDLGFGPFDAGWCETPAGLLPDCESWVSAAPLLGLSGPQFLKLHVPMVQNTKHLWSLRHQFLKSEDRTAILDAQAEVWSDDEFRHQIGLLLALRTAKRFDVVNNPERNCMMLDPLLLMGWVHHGTALCSDWAKSHPEIYADGTIILSACVLHGHWIPVVLTPNGCCLNFSTWDSPGHDHVKLNEASCWVSHMLAFCDTSECFSLLHDVGPWPCLSCTMKYSIPCCLRAMMKLKWFIPV